MTTIAAAAIILVCLMIIVEKICNAYYEKRAIQFSKFKPYAIKAFDFVEKAVPNDFGADEADPEYAKAIHKLDMFCAKFLEYSKRFNGTDASGEMMEKAKDLAAKLAAVKKLKE